MDDKVQEIIDAFNKLSPDNQVTFLEFVQNIFNAEKPVSETDLVSRTSMDTK